MDTQARAPGPGAALRALVRATAPRLFSALRDLAPIVIIIAIFQLLVVRQPFPDLVDVLVGAGFVVVGLMLFVQGLEMGLFPLGDAVAVALARCGSVAWLLLFAFALGFTTTVAEPALIAVAGEAAEVAAASGIIGGGPGARETYALQLRITVALAVGVAILVGVLRILRGWPVHWLVIGGYVVVVLLTLLAPEPIIGIAYDSGGVTTSTVTVPLVTALGVGLATSIRGRSPLRDGFGLIAFASLTPMAFVLIFGMIRFAG